METSRGYLVLKREATLLAFQLLVFHPYNCTLSSLSLAPMGSRPETPSVSLVAVTQCSQLPKRIDITL